MSTKKSPKTKHDKFTPTWVKEFGESFAVPELIVRTLADASWHNDICPSFVFSGLAEDTGLRLWVDHPDMSKREVESGHRYWITNDVNDTVWEGDDGAEALTEMMRLHPDDKLSHPRVELDRCEPPVGKNPRFIWIIGDPREAFPDVPEKALHTVQIWDRQEQRSVVAFNGIYHNVYLFEKTDHGTAGYPLTHLCNWLNSLDNVTLESEGITKTRKEFRS